MAAWVYLTADPSAIQAVIELNAANTSGNQRTSLRVTAPAVSGFKVQVTARGTTDGQWSSSDVSINARHHIAMTYDRGATTNDPVIYVDGVSVTVTETATPVALSTGDDTLRFGENAGGTGDLAGAIENPVVEGGILWDAAQINRAMWWGRPHGGMDIYLPFLTAKLIDDGASGEALTASGTTVNNSIPTPCVRAGTAMMGMGVGW
jgi:hypothetical protein